MKEFLKTKKMRKAVKSARIEYKQQAKRDKVRHIRQTELCSTCDPLSCICRDNQRSAKLINIFRSATVLLLLLLLLGCSAQAVVTKPAPLEHHKRYNPKPVM